MRIQIVLKTEKQFKKIVNGIHNVDKMLSSNVVCIK